MKKIKRIQDIEREKLRLKVQQLEQEKKLKDSWDGLKHDLKPGNFLRNKLNEFTHSKPDESGLVTGLVNVGAAYLSRRLTGYAGNKIDSTIHTGIEKASERLKTFLLRKKKKKRSSKAKE
ncbi:MAG TPA: hypothetical protein PLU11_09265 [Chitinophagaceae bacterium]|nr:hypothetical protein [Chitinophagaceae bacterium]HPH31585.1 hypothetical protein [Chitinophagaceae bacterium]HPN59351.1 hypothetical protein [Chitinophagaceae bacterium]